MPFGDRTGPMGWGPRTGRGAGFCAAFAAPGWVNPAAGSGFCGGGRGGRGSRNWFHATGLTGWQRSGFWPWSGIGPSGPSRQQQASALKNWAEQLEATLREIRKRIEELEAGGKAE